MPTGDLHVHPDAPRTFPRAAPLAGAVRIRVRYCECDPMGVAHHAAYAPWLEVGRTELIRETGTTYADLERSGTFLVITRLECRYRRPIFYDDLVEVRTRVTGGSRVKIEHEYDIALIDDGGHGRLGAARAAGDILAAAATTLACVGKEGRVQPLPDWLVPSTPNEPRA